MHEKYMAEALRLAGRAAECGEVPVGCVIVDGSGRIVGRGRNTCEADLNPCAHAELAAITEACAALGSRRLTGCSMYVTLEPCPMCAGAILNARVSNLFYGAKEPNFGSCGSIINLFMENYGFSPKIRGGIMAEECGEALTSFFEKLRKSGEK